MENLLSYTLKNHKKKHYNHVTVKQKKAVRHTKKMIIKKVTDLA
jgi:hypothetical protein